MKIPSHFEGSAEALLCSHGRRVRVLKRNINMTGLAALEKRTAERVSGSRVGKGTGKGCQRLKRDTDFMIIL